MIFGFFAYSCTSKKDLEILAFNPVSNFNTTNDTLLLSMDLSEAVLNGITIPTKNQCAENSFIINYKIKNNTDKSQVYYYKIFYQNETYKNTEFIDEDGSIIYNKKSENNFYGSWGDTLEGFHKTTIIPNDGKEYLITDFFRITGNPRNERKYFGPETGNLRLTEEKIKENSDEIRRIPEWFQQIKEKSVKNNVSVDEQLYNDAVWNVKEKSQKGNFNNRWKRNPRVGSYSFVLVIATEEEHDKLPESLKDISKTGSGKFINPYYELFYKSKNENENKFLVIKSNYVLKTHAQFNPGSGLYINLLKFNNPVIDTTYFSHNCGSSIDIFKNAQFEQFFHNINKNYKLNNVPVSADITGNNYLLYDYNRNAEKFKPNELISDFVQVTKSPGKTAGSDPQTNSLYIKTPGNESTGFKKENTGINSRIGFTYGKFIAKIKFPSIINKENVWNGLTCAYWLIFQDEREWNNRSICDSSGYLYKGDNTRNSPRMKTTYYSEIDFEILKTSKYWPATSYENPANIPSDDPKSNHNIIVTCTNWDLACKSPESFSVGAKEFQIGNKNYTTHRWDDWYKALTIKHEINHDSIFNKPFYYEIDWQPDKIIWRIGEEKNKMIEVGYMDNTITTIPDNQMLIVFSQEFHDSKWWPLSPFVQDLIPFPKNEIVTQVLEVVVE